MSDQESENKLELQTPELQTPEPQAPEEQAPEQQAPEPQRHRIEFKPLEIVMIGFGTLLFGSSFAIYVSDFPLRNYLFGLTEEKGKKTIGKVSQSSGVLKREILGQTEFRAISINDELFQEDTVVTSKDGKATLTLDDGSTIELGGATMVKLEGEASFSLTGVSRSTRIEVVNGSVTGRAASADAQIVIASNDQVIQVSKEKPAVLKASNEKPFIPTAPPPSRSASKAKSSLLSFFKSEPKPVPPPAKVVPVTATKSAPEPTTAPIAIPRPTIKPTPVASPTPSPTPTPSPSPSPSPSPTPKPSPKVMTFQIQIRSPQDGFKFALAKNTSALEKEIPLQWSISGLKTPGQLDRIPATQVTVAKIDGNQKNILFKNELRTRNGTESLKWLAKAPGEYEFEVQAAPVPGIQNAPSNSKKVRFKLDSDFEAIQLSSPESKASIAADGKRIPSVKFAWKPVTGASTYTLRILKDSAARNVIKEFDVKSPEYTINRTPEYPIQAYYDVIAQGANGFHPRSPAQKFIFAFPAPDLIAPTDQQVIGAEDDWKENGVLLTWRSISQTQGYVLEIAKDAQFRHIVWKRSQKDNFFIFGSETGAAPGTYYWRVSSVNEGITSQPSKTWRLVIKN